MAVGTPLVALLQTELLHTTQTHKNLHFADSNMNGRVKSEESGSSIGEDDDIATVEETFDETSSGLANTSPNRGSSPLLAAIASSKSETSSPTSAAVASVQAALAALQAGQMSLNQVN